MGTAPSEQENADLSVSMNGAGVSMDPKMHQHKLNVISSSVFVFVNAHDNPMGKTNEKKNITVYTAVCYSKENTR